MSAAPDAAADVVRGRRRWRVLTGDEIGCVLARHLLASGPRDGTQFVATTVVSSRLLQRIAETYGARYGETLTGFKWLARAAEDAAAEGYRLVIAYEQALGVMLGNAVRDKDGMTAALVLADLAAGLEAKGSTIAAMQDELAEVEGAYATAGRSLRLEGPDGAAVVERTMHGLRENPPAQVGRDEVVSFADYAAGSRTDRDGTVGPTGIPPAELIELVLAGGARVLVRPSGTEPLLKFYAEVVRWKPDDPGWHLRWAARGQARELLGEFIALAVPSP